MPGFDGTGPMGFGPMTGRGNGYCAGFVQPGFANSIRGRGFGRGRGGGFGRGRGFGWRRGFGRRNIPVEPYEQEPYREQDYPQSTQYREPLNLSKEEQRKILGEEMKYLGEEVEAIKRKLKELE